MTKYLPKLIGAFINFIAVFTPNYAGKLAMQLFSIPRKGKLKPDETPFLNTAEQTKFQYENFNITAYQWKGSGDTVLLAHGWESNSFRWKDLVITLKKQQFNIVALDAPAHGGTGNKKFNAILFSECIHVIANQFKPKIVIGHSVGGMASVFAMHNHNITSITKLVLLGAPDAFSNILNGYETIMGFNNQTKKGIRAYILKTFKFLPEHFSTSNFTSNLNIDALIIHDKKDRIISFSDALNIKNKFPNAKLIETRGYGHSLKSDKIYKHILDFLNH